MIFFCSFFYFSESYWRQLSLRCCCRNQSSFKVIHKGPVMKYSYLFIFIFLTSSLLASPDFLVIGITKGGTTSLYDYLVHHPKILGSRKKELHFFDNDHAFKKGLGYYKSLFPVKKNHDDLAFEASPGYFWKKVCAQRIAKAYPKTKLILILRNPVKRAISHYFYFFYSRWPNKSFEDAIKVKGITSLHQKSNWYQIVEAGYYLEHLQRWFELFPREQMHIVILEDLIKNPELEVNKVFNFLGLSGFKLDSYVPKNQGSYANNGSITPESIKMLEQLYEPHNKKLEEFLGRTLPWDTAKNVLDDECFV